MSAAPAFAASKILRYVSPVSGKASARPCLLYLPRCDGRVCRATNFKSFARISFCPRARICGKQILLGGVQAEVLDLQTLAVHTCEVWMDASLHADLCCPSVPGLRCAPRDLCHGQQVRRATQVLCNLAFAEGTKLAGVDAPVGVVDVTIHSVGDPGDSKKVLRQVPSGSAMSGNMQDLCTTRICAPFPQMDRAGHFHLMTVSPPSCQRWQPSHFPEAIESGHKTCAGTSPVKKAYIQ